jgi:hypothetical protein
MAMSALSQIPHATPCPGSKDEVLLFSGCFSEKSAFCNHVHFSGNGHILSIQEKPK